MCQSLVFRMLLILWASALSLCSGADDVELATVQWVDRWNNLRLLELIGMILPAEAVHYRHKALAEKAVT